ncbi:hypothetical protein B0H11DRAFT_2238883 [Mycena galericulata]|nr:hypothetical protein B0H11DRAFT_2238883 [Mycena galericulata]
MAYRRNVRNNTFNGGMNLASGVAAHENGPALSSRSALEPSPIIHPGPRSSRRARNTLEAGIDEAARRARAAGLTNLIDMVQARIRELDNPHLTPAATVAAARRTQARETRAATVSPLYRGLGANPARFRQTRNREGAREIRETPLTHEALWVNGTGPLEQPAPQQDHHGCGICHRVKSHPVSYTCGHSHCYVCIRLWLERDWRCPECSQKMPRAPFRQFAEEASIAAAYPNWRDESRVEYRWDGLVFPQPASVIALESL